LNLTKEGILQTKNLSEIGPTEGLVAYYPLDGNIEDYSGLNNHGTNYGAVESIGVRSGAYSFDGIDNYISLPDDIGYTTQVSAFAWFKSLGAAAGGYHIIFGGQELEISIPTSGEIRAGIYTSARYVSNHGSGLLDGDWHHVGLTYDGSIKRAYIDGSYVGQQSAPDALVYSFANRVLGKYGSNTTYWANGLIDEVRIYNRALTEQEIQILYDIYRPGGPTMKQINDTIYLRGELKGV
jgi:hypothetical protein